MNKMKSILDNLGRHTTWVLKDIGLNRGHDSFVYATTPAPVPSTAPHVLDVVDIKKILSVSETITTKTMRYLLRLIVNPCHTRVFNAVVLPTFYPDYRFSERDTKDDLRKAALEFNKKYGAYLTKDPDSRARFCVCAVNVSYRHWVLGVVDRERGVLHCIDTAGVNRADMSIVWSNLLLFTSIATPSTGGRTRSGNYNVMHHAVPRSDDADSDYTCRPDALVYIVQCLMNTLHRTNVADVLGRIDPTRLGDKVARVNIFDLIRSMMRAPTSAATDPDRVCEQITELLKSPATNASDILAEIRKL